MVTSPSKAIKIPFTGGQIILIKNVHCIVIISLVAATWTH